MSLVERAARRLEELAKAASQSSGDAALPSPRGEGAGSLVERAVHKIEPAARPLGAQDISSVAPQIEAQGSVRGSGADRDTPQRREPKLGSAVTRPPAVAAPPRIPIGAPPRAPRIDLDLPKLGSAGYLEPEDPESMMANEFRKIKRPIIQACQGKLAAPVANANRIMVTSSVPGEGKSFVSLNLALSIAMERDSTVLLIDADTTRRSLSRLLGTGSHPGLLDLLGGNSVEVSDALMRTNVERLTLLSAGQPRRHATELLASEAMEQLVEELASRYTDRILIFDTPPLLGAPEPAVLATHMGQILVVVEADKTTHRVLTNALTTVQSCPLVTTILNKATARADSGYYYYAA
jgi:receptor protein-tyrosine kinase